MNPEKNKRARYQNPVRAIFTGITDLFRKPVNEKILTQNDRLDGKKVLITGSSSGLGFATAVELAKRGAHVIMLVRSGIPMKGEEVKRKSGSDKIDMVHVDLSKPETLKTCAIELKNRFGQFDLVICNAAMVANKSRPIHGIDEMFLVNYFAKFLMINYLIKNKCVHNDGDSIPRLIFVASESHRDPDNFDWDSFGKYESYGTGKSVAMYGYYKLLLLTMVTELSKKLNPEGNINYSVFSLCPGPVNSNIAREAPAIFQPILKLVFGILFRSPSKACRPVIYLAASHEMEGKTGDYMFLMQHKEIDEKALDPENGKRLWKMSEDLISLLNL